MSAPVAVIGAGWAGLAAAVTLVRRGVPVRLFEAARQPGGRARTAPALGVDVDNGQHIAIGAYRSVLDLAHAVGVAADSVFGRHPFTLVQRDARGVQLSLRAPANAGRMGLAAAFAGARGFSPLDKLMILRGWRRLLETPTPDLSVSEHLRVAGQPPRAVRLLWAPLCIATLNTPPDKASARIFARVLNEAFGAATRGATDLLLPACALGAGLPGPAAEWLARHGAAPAFGERVTALHGSDRIDVVATNRGRHDVSGVISAVPPDACARLLETVPGTDALRAACRRFDTQPICTVYLRYPGQVRLEQPLLGLTGTLTQWLVDRRTCGQDGVIAAVISAEGDHMDQDNDVLIRRVRREIAECLPDLPDALDARVIREKRATFAAVVGIDGIRPRARTAIPGLVLAGDWTDTGLPATLEGAVRSGYAAADAMLDHSWERPSGRDDLL